MTIDTKDYKIETGILLEKVRYSETAIFKICIPTLTPLLNTSSIYSETKQLKSKSNLINQSLPINKIVIKNYFDIVVPKYLRVAAPTDTYGYILPGTKFLIAFVGGDLSNPKVIAVQ